MASESSVTQTCAVIIDVASCTVFSARAEVRIVDLGHRDVDARRRT
jgi:hypothetical protein